MGNYTEMAEYYDTIMLSGYYDYDLIAKSIDYLYSGTKILEVGCGSGLILERLAKQIQVNSLSLTGVDLTEAMLEIAKKRLSHIDSAHIQLFEQNVVTLQLPEYYDMAFSYGGPWYFSKQDGQLRFISHLLKHADNEQSLERLSHHIRSGGSLLLGIQGGHYDYSTTISNGMLYSQKITPTDKGFMKDYYLSKRDDVVMSQRLHYRVYSFEEAVDMLSQHQLEYQSENEAQLFTVFKKA
jgi:SAM-dependent methyltransferase